MITAKALDENIKSMRQAELFSALQAMPEADRLALSKAAVKSFNSAWESGILQLVENAKTALLFCADFPQLKTAAKKYLPTSDVFFAVFSARKPEWLDQWCSFMLQKWPWDVWHVVFQLESVGACTLQHPDNYYQAIALGLPTKGDLQESIANSPMMRESFYDYFTRPLALRTMAEPHQVLQELFVLRFNGSTAFEISPETTKSTLEGTAFSALWVDTIAGLADSGVLNRETLIDLCFQNLTIAAENPKKKMSGWVEVGTVAGFLCTLQAQLVKDPARYYPNFCPLLGATNSEVASYAISVFLTAPESDLPVSEILENIPLVFRNSDKEPASLAIKLLGRLDLLFKDRSNDIGAVVPRAFEHKSKGIHKEAIDLIIDRDFHKNDAVQSLLQKYIDLLVGTNRSAVSKLISKPTTSTQADVTTVIPSTLQGIPPNLNDEFCDIAGLKSLHMAARTLNAKEMAECAVRPVYLYSTKIPRLFPDQKLTPIKNIDDLIYLSAAGLKERLSGIQIEQLYDGIARLGQQRPPDFVTKTENLRQALSQTDSKIWFSVPSTDSMIVVFIWIFLKSAPRFWIFNPCSLLYSRALGLCARLLAGLSLPMLAAPTHKNGYIDPSILVERICEYQRQGRLLTYGAKVSAWADIDAASKWIQDSKSNAYYADAPEFLQALLRLAPDGRAAALREEQKIQGEFGSALRYALGEGELHDIESPQLALTAFRSRFPFKTADMDNSVIKDHFPDGIHPAQYIFSSEVVEKQLDDRFSTIRTMLPAFLDTTRNGIDTFPRARELAASYSQLDRYAVNAELAEFELLPTVALHTCLSNAWSVGDISLVWLQNREPMLAQISKNILIHVKSIGTFWQQDYSSLFDSDFPMHKNGNWWFAITLAVKGDDLRRVALDVLVAAVAENRADPDLLGETMALLTALTSTKWTKALRELARVSALHALASWRVVMNFLANATGKANLAFLELALELYEEHRFLPTENAITALKNVEGAGKAAKIAKQLVTVGCDGPASESLQKAVEQSFGSRLARVERWHKSTYHNDRAQDETIGPSQRDGKN